MGRLYGTLAGFIGLTMLAWGALSSGAQESPQGFTYEGRLYNAAGTAPLTDIVDFKFQIFNSAPPADTCLLYEEVQLNVDLTLTAGTFAINVGSPQGAAKRTLGPTGDPNLTLATIFQNLNSVPVPVAICPGGLYTPLTGEARNLKVTVTPHSIGVPQVLAPDYVMSSVPQALVCESLQGIGPAGLIQVTANITQVNLATLTAGVASDASALHNHDTHNDTRYARIGGVGNQNLGSGNLNTTGNVGIGIATPPAANLDIEEPAPTLRLGATGATGQSTSLDFYGGAGANYRASIASVDNSSVLNFFTGGNALANLALQLDASQNAIFSKSMTIKGTVGLGQYTSAQEISAPFVAALTPATEGMTWDNINLHQLRYWDGTTVQSIATSANSVSSVTAGTGITMGGTANAPTVSVNYGIAAGTAIQGNASFGGDASGTYNALNITGLQGRSIAAAAPNPNDALIWNNGTSKWTPTAIVTAPSGVNTQIQYNNAGAFGGSTDFIWDNANHALVVDTTSAPLGNAFSIFQNPKTSATNSLVQLGATNIVAGSLQGTFIGANPAAFTGDFLRFQIGNSTKYTIENTGTPGTNTDLANKAYVDTQAAAAGGNFLKKDGSINLTADWAASPSNLFKITGLKDPSLAQDAATRNYVDTQTSNTNYLLNTGGILTGPLVNNSTSASTALAVTQAGAGYASTFMGGNVGIGTITPSAALQVIGTSATNNIPVVATIIQGQAAGPAANGEGVEEDFYTKFDVGPLKAGSFSFVPDMVNTAGSAGSTFKIALSGNFFGGTSAIQTALTLNQEGNNTLGGINLSQGLITSPIVPWDVGVGAGTGMSHAIAANAKSNGSLLGAEPLGVAYDFYLTDINLQKRLAYIGASATAWNATPTADLIFATNNAGTVSEKMRITGAGNVGIGTISPATPLQVIGTAKIGNGGTNSALLVDGFNTVGSVFSVYSNWSGGTFNIAPGGAGGQILVTAAAANDMELGANNAVIMTLNRNGKVGVGTTNPTAAGFQVSTAGVASVSGEKLDGAWFTGGTATTTKPQFLVEPAAAVSTAWSTNGTGVGLNAAAGFTGNLIDAQLNGVSKFSVDYTGKITGDGSLLTGIATADGTKVLKTGDTMIGPLVNNSNSASTALAVTQAGAGYAATLMGGNVGIGTTTPTAGLHVATTGAASLPGERLDGAWFTGGTATTTKPYLLVEPAGTASGAWSTNGTGIGANAAAGFAGNLIDLKLNQASIFNVNSAAFATLTSASGSYPGLKIYGSGINAGADLVLQDSSHGAGWDFHVAGGGNGDLTLYANGTPMMNWYFGVGIGTSNQKSKLDVNGNMTVGSYAGVTAAPANGLTVSGNVGIGTATPTAGLHNSTAGLASAPGEQLDGAWFTGGTATTTKPQLLVEPSGTSTTAWSTNGTGVGINASAGFNGNLIDAQLNGVSKFSVDKNGVITGNGSGLTGLTPGAAGLDKQIQFNNATAMSGSANFLWDTTANKLAVGTSALTGDLTIGKQAATDIVIAAKSINGGTGDAGRFIQYQNSGGADLFYVDGNGSVFANSSSASVYASPLGGFILGGSWGFWKDVGTNTELQTAYGIKIDNATIPLSNTNPGSNIFMDVQPTVNQSGVNGYTALNVNVTETATGSGTKNLLTLGVGGVPNFTVNTAGNVTAAGTVSSLGFSATQWSLQSGSTNLDSNNQVLTMPNWGNTSYIQNNQAGANSNLALRTNNGSLLFQTGGASTRLVVDNSGNVGIGTPTPQAGLDVATTGTGASAIIVPRDTTPNRPTVLVNGMIRYNTTSALFEFYQAGGWVNFTPVSDARLKTNIEPVTNALGIVDQLRPVYFDWDQKNPRAQSFGTKHQVGFLAQDVEKVLPEVVNQGEDTYRTLEYGKMVSVAIAAIKELYAKVMGHDRDVSSLKNEITLLKQENADIKVKESALEAWACSQTPQPAFCK